MPQDPFQIAFGKPSAARSTKEASLSSSDRLFEKAFAQNNDVTPIMGNKPTFATRISSLNSTFGREPLKFGGTGII